MRETGHSAGAGGACTLIGPLVVVAVAALAACAIGPATPGRRRAIVFAAAVCAVGSLASWAAGRRARATPAGRVTAALAAMGLRLGPALVALGWLQSAGGTLAADRAGAYLVIFYLAALAAEVIRTIMVERRGARRRGDTTTI